METSSSALPIGFILDDRYEIRQFLGAGGFGMTYKAYDRLNRIPCAIKEYMQRMVAVRMPDCSLQPSSERTRTEYMHGRKRFVEEAETLKKLSAYRNIVNITDFFDENNTSYFVMEYLDGITLSTLAQSMGGRIPYKDALDIICQVCDGLEIVHTKAGMFHRDISPDNIMILVGEDGKATVKIIDFGNAKNISLNDTMSVVLKSHYAPFEQYSSKSRQGSFTDVYSLACSFYFILTGAYIPSAPDRWEGKAYTPLVDMDVGVPKHVSEVVDKALKIQPRERIQTMGEFKKLLLAGQPEKTENRRKQKEELYIPVCKPFFDVMRGENEGKRFLLEAGRRYTLGRSKKAVDICLDTDGRMSRIHGTITYDTEASAFCVEDTHSTNGIYIDDTPLVPGQRHMVQAGKEITFGNHVCEIKVGVVHE